VEIDNRIRLSYQGMKVLRVFLNAFDENVRKRLAGADIMRAANVSSGTMYPLLIRLEEAGLIESKWETESPQSLGRPRRRLYRLTAAGVPFVRSRLESVLPASLLQPQRNG
jgi:PadR family transcriptional regulator, regulatory protein PadR